jgi:WD40 repeat protein
MDGTNRIVGNTNVLPNITTVLSASATAATAILATADTASTTTTTNGQTTSTTATSATTTTTITTTAATDTVATIGETVFPFIGSTSASLTAEPEGTNRSNCCRYVIDGHDSEVTALAQLSNGWLVTASSDSSLKLWNLYGEKVATTTTGKVVGSSNNRPMGLTGESHNSNHSIADTNSNTNNNHNHSSGNNNTTTTSLNLVADTNGDNSFFFFGGHINSPYSATVGRIAARRRPSAGPIIFNSDDCSRVLEGHTGGVNCVCVLTDGCTLASGGGDRTIRIWDTVSGTCIKILEGHSRYLMCISLLSDGFTIASGSGDNTIRLWSYK